MALVSLLDSRQSSGTIATTAHLLAVIKDGIPIAILPHLCFLLSFSSLRPLFVFPVPSYLPCISLSSPLPSPSSGGILLTLLSKFATCVADSVDGKGSTAEGVEMNDLYGGARISYIFNEVQ